MLHEAPGASHCPVKVRGKGQGIVCGGSGQPGLVTLLGGQMILHLPPLMGPQPLWLLSC